MIKILLVEFTINFDLTFGKLIKFYEKEFDHISIHLLNKWIDEISPTLGRVKYGTLTNSDCVAIEKYGGSIIRNGAILLKDRKKTYMSIYNKEVDISNSATNQILISVEKALLNYKIDSILNSI
jgi:hypothetical protein